MSFYVEHNSRSRSCDNLMAKMFNLGDHSLVAILNWFVLPVLFKKPSSILLRDNKSLNRKERKKKYQCSSVFLNFRNSIHVRTCSTRRQSQTKCKPYVTINETDLQICLNWDYNSLFSSVPFEIVVAAAKVITAF